ncbi:helix-turn-helix domain-containing protein [Halomarina litorea]|uniref:helix-turn-helix domain-containing protein n=1 Tax=Halomarina litorea TaxID=2961595 RepID=UPI0020C36592|nr:helix-turn-helix domain-containing protein [Halomarina sp. BCD28]
MPPDTSIIAEVRVTHPEQMFYHASRAVPEAVIESRYHAAATAGVPYLFYSVECPDYDAFDAALVEDGSVRNPVVVAAGDGDRLYRVEPTPGLLVVPELVRQGGALLSGTCQDGTWTSRFQFPDREALVEFGEYCRNLGVTFDVRRLFSVEDHGEWGDAGLTEPQREALLVAFECGFFDDPRTATLEDVADALGISSTAAGRRLRRGTYRLVETVLTGSG